MLGNKDAMATIAVKKLDVARDFYETKLGFERIGPPEPHMAAYRSGGAVLMIYESGYAGTNRATSATWNLGPALEGQVRELKEKGIRFEHYELPDTTRDGDIHISGKHKVAWFKDPDGNILSLAGE